MAGYGEDADFDAWVAENGFTVPENARAVAVLRQRGSSYLDGFYEAKFVGQRTGGLTQERAWPRSGAQAYGADIPSDMVPLAVEHASYHAALYEAQNPGKLVITASASGALKRKKLDGLEKEYFEGSGDVVADGILRLSAVEGLLSPFFRTPEIAVFVV